MGYGEVGGDDSVQVNVWLRDPEVADVELGGGRSPFDNAHTKDPNRLSNKLRNAVLPNVNGNALCFVGKDKQGKASTETNLGDFTVTVRFQNNAERDAAKERFQQATGLEVEFKLKVRKAQAGQIQIEWD